MQDVLKVGLGGMVGASLRYALSFMFSAPFATLCCNLLGAFLLAYILTKYQRSLFFGTGVLGAFTTFSTFSAEVITLPLSYACSYVVITLIGGALASWSGIKLAGVVDD